MANPNSTQCDQVLVSGGWCELEAEYYDEVSGESYCAAHMTGWDKWRMEQADQDATREAEQASWEQYRDQQADIRGGLRDAGLLD